MGNNPNPFAVIVLANLYVLQTKDDDEKRLSLKEQVYELARKRNYSDEKINSLLTFVGELMVLPEELRIKFNQYIFKSSKFNKMPYITEQTRSLVDTFVKGDFGRTASEMNEERAKTVALLFTKYQVTAEEIAKDLDLDVKVVRRLLKKQNLIKK